MSSNDKDKKIRFSTILEDVNNIDPYKTQSNTAYLDDYDRLAVKKSVHGADWNIEDSIRDKFHKEFNHAQASENYNKHVYGFCVDMNEADPSSAVTYTDEAIGFTPLVMKQRERCAYGSWKEFIANFVGCRPCALYEDGTIYRYLDPEDYTKDIDGNKVGIDGSNAFDEYGRPYNIMVEFKHCWYRMYTKNSKFYFQVANYKVNDDFIDDAFLYNGQSMNYMYISAFATEFYTVNSVQKIRSLYYRKINRLHHYEKYNTNDNLSADPDLENIVASLPFQRKLYRKDYSNSSTLGYAQYIYILLLLQLVTKQCHPVMIFDRGITTSGGYGDWTSINITDDIRNKYETKSYNKGLFYCDENLYDLYNAADNKPSKLCLEKFFGLDFSSIICNIILDGLYRLKKDIYYETAPYTITTLNDMSESNKQYNIPNDVLTNNRLEPLNYPKVYNNRIIGVDFNKLLPSNLPLNRVVPILFEYGYLATDSISSVEHITEIILSFRNNGPFLCYVEGAPIDRTNYNKRGLFCQFR